MDAETKTKFEHCLARLTNATEIINKIPKGDWDIASMQKYCEEFIGAFSAEQFDQYMRGDSKLTDFNFAKLLTNLEHFSAKLDTLLVDSNEWSNYNNQYQTYMLGLLQAIEDGVTNLVHCFEVAPGQITQLLSQVYHGLVQLEQCFNNSISELYDNFKYGNKNYVVFGKNGAGKTTLLKKISSEVINANSFVIPADRSVVYQTTNYIGLNLNFDLNKKLSDEKAIHYLSYDMNAKSLKQYEADAGKENVTNTRLVEIFRTLGVERQVFSDDNKLRLFAQDKSTAYDLQTGSDGERTAIYMIMGILLLPENSFVFIDEPENNLNGALMRKLFDALEAERRDVRFVYLTHNIDFIETRKNFELIYLEKTNDYKAWHFNKIADFNELDLDVILNIEGIKDDILFCEGNDRTSIDCKILKALYPNIEIMPVASCEKVIDNTKGLNGKQHMFRRNAFQRALIKKLTHRTLTCKYCQISVR